MSKHWRPDEDRVDGGKRLRSLDEFAPPEFLGRMERVRRYRLPEGAKAGLLFVAAACVGLAIGMYQAFGPIELFAPGSDIPTEMETAVPSAPAP
jgi:hypothetical protein